MLELSEVVNCINSVILLSFRYGMVLIVLGIRDLVNTAIAYQPIDTLSVEEADAKGHPYIFNNDDVY